MAKRKQAGQALAAANLYWYEKNYKECLKWLRIVGKFCVDNVQSDTKTNK
jgi:hypothetical protein